MSDRRLESMIAATLEELTRTIKNAMTEDVDDIADMDPMIVLPNPDSESRVTEGDLRQLDALEADLRRKMITLETAVEQALRASVKFERLKANLAWRIGAPSQHPEARRKAAEPPFTDSCHKHSRSE